MDPELLAKMLQFYRSTADKANTTFKCLEEGGSAEDALVVEAEGDKVTIRLQGPMDGFFGISAADVIAELDEKDPKEISLLIESPGGFVSEGVALYADIRARAKAGVKVEAESRGVVASAAVLPYLAADDRAMGDGAMLMIHNPWAMTFAVGDAEDIEKNTNAILNGLKAHTENYAQIVAERTDLTVADATKAMGAETWYSAEAAVSAGYAKAATKAPVNKTDRQLMAQARERMARGIVTQFRR